MKRLLLIIALVGLVDPAASRAQTRDFEWRGRVAGGGELEIRGINGAIHAEDAAGNEAEVTATKRGRRSDPDEVRIEVVEHRRGVMICAVYPASRGEGPNTCGDSQHVRDNDVRVDFYVRVPAGVRFVARTVNGEIDARSLRADVDATTINGDVEVSTTGIAEATTVNGSIDAVIGRADWEGELRFKTVNGGITVEFPEGVNADIRAKTVNGYIDTDFPLQVSGRLSRRRLSGRIGDGGPPLDLETVNGSIELRRAR